MSEHRCHAYACDTPAPPRFFMCPRHWRMLPNPLQREIWRAYRPGQEVDKQPSAEYLAVTHRPIALVAEMEGLPIPEYYRARPDGFGGGNAMSAQPAPQSTRIPLAEGQRIAHELVGLLGDSGTRLEVVGSVRRKAPTVKDVELLVEPCYETRTVDLFGSTTTDNLLEARCAELREQIVFNPNIPRSHGEGQATAWGPRLKRFMFGADAYPYAAVQVELYIVLPPSQWGLASVVRTGPAEFSHQIVTPKGQRCSSNGRPGFMPRDLVVHDFGYYRGVTLLATPEEESVFELLGFPYIEPEARR